MGINEDRSGLRQHRHWAGEWELTLGVVGVAWRARSVVLEIGVRNQLCVTRSQRCSHPAPLHSRFVVLAAGAGIGDRRVVEDRSCLAVNTLEGGQEATAQGDD